MNGATLRITLRQNRFELFTLVAATVVVLLAHAAAVVARGRIEAAGCTGADMPVECYTGFVIERLVIGFSSMLTQVAMVVPVFLGVILGVRLVGLEVERGTAALPWTLGRSRVRWLVERFVIVGAIVVASGIAIGLSNDFMLTVEFPKIDLGASLWGFASRSWLVPAYGLVAFSLAALFGAAMGRVLPALIVTLLAGLLVYIGTMFLFSNVHAAEAVVLNTQQVNQMEGGGVCIGDCGGGSGDSGPDSNLPNPNIQTDTRLREKSTGRILTYQDAWSASSTGEIDWALYDSVEMGVPGTRSLFIVGREVAWYGTFAAACVAGTAFVVRKRRPY